VRDLAEGFDTKLWECSKTHYEQISTQFHEYGIDLMGMMLSVQKQNGRWVMAANAPKRGKEVPATVLESAWNEVVQKGLGGPETPEFDEKAFGEVVGVVASNALQRAMLVNRSKGKAKDWNDVRRLFKLPPVADGGAVENDTEEYD
jgi:hypothetical protein